MIALREVLGRLDNAHGELVYATLYFRYIQTGIFKQIDASKIIYLPSGIRIWKGVLHLNTFSMPMWQSLLYVNIYE